MQRLPSPPFCVEFLVLDDMLEGTAAAVCDVLQLVNLLAATRGVRRLPITWQ